MRRDLFTSDPVGCSEKSSKLVGVAHHFRVLSVWSLDEETGGKLTSSALIVGF